MHIEDLRAAQHSLRSHRSQVELVVKGGRRQWDDAWGTLERNAKAR